MTYNLAYQVSVPNHPDRAVMLDYAFCHTNSDDRPLGRQVCSTSVGDLMLVKGEYWLVDNVGFRMLDEQQAVAWQKITVRDTSAGWDFCVKNGIITAAGQVLRN